MLVYVVCRIILYGVGSLLVLIALHGVARRD